MSYQEQEFSMKKLFVPLTTFKAIHIIVIVGFIVFGNMLFNGFVWDDKIYIIFNPDVHSIDFFKLIGHNFFNTDGQYRPIPALYFATFYSLFKDITFFYHFFQLVLHIVNTSLLFIVLNNFFNKKLSLILSLIFLVHPIQVESVSYIASSGNPLFFLFGIIALLLSMKDKIDKGRVVLICCFLLLSFLTKETGLLFFLLILLYRFLFRKNGMFFFIYGLITVIVYIFLRISIAGIYLTERDLTPIARLSISERLINIPEITLYYIKTFFFPIQLAIHQQWIITSTDFLSFYLPLLLNLLFILALFFLGIHLLKKEITVFKKFLFFFFWFLLGLGFHMQVFPLDMTVADRWFYFSIVGILGLLGFGLQEISKKNQFKNIVILTAVIILILLSVRTMVRNTNWKDAISLYEHDRKIHTNYNIENNLGAEYGSLHQYEKALEHYKNSAKFLPMKANLYNIGYMYEKMGDNQRSKEYYFKAVAVSEYFQMEGRNVSVPHERLGRLLVLTDKPEIARDFAKSALQIYPNKASLWLDLAISEFKLGNQEEALTAAEKAKTLLPNEGTNYFYIQILNKQPIDLNHL